jgi:hypothetical protein
MTPRTKAGAATAPSGVEPFAYPKLIISLPEWVSAIMAAAPVSLAGDLYVH